MKTLKTLILMGLISITSLAANAAYIDFAALGQNPNERGYDPALVLSYASFDVTITAGANYAYLDSGTGGLGVCKNLGTIGTITDQCKPSSDDSVQTGEMLTFVFNRDVYINSIFFNNNHDGGFAATGSTIDINGNLIATFTETAKSYNNKTLVSANTAFTIAYADTTFYVQNMDVSRVPEATSLMLLLVGFVGLVSLRKRNV